MTDQPKYHAKGHTSFRSLEEVDGLVLVVDDELHNRLYMKKLLEARGCRVLEAENGGEALILAREKLPDLILVDVMMPGMDGFELCGRLQSEARTTDIPVMMVTAKSKIEDIETGFELGAMDYIRKPFNPRELVLRVGNALALKRSNDALMMWNNRIARDLELAGAIQQSLFSNVPHFSERFEARIAYRSCMDVGGDAFDIISLPNGKHCFYVADVSGHGVAPAMISALIKAAVNEMAGRYADKGPAAICNALNYMMRRKIDNPSYFSTLFLAIHDPERMEWRCMNCGHPNPVYVRNGKLGDSSVFGNGGGVPIGFPFGEEMPYSWADEVVFMDEGDTFLLLYTDGLTDARNLETKIRCGNRAAEVYEKLVADSTESDKALRLMETLEAEHYILGEDDCTVISIHMLDPVKIVIDRRVSRNIQLVSQLAKEAEDKVKERGISAEKAGVLRLLIMELGANLVNHSGLAEDDLFWIQLRVDGNVCQLVVVDNGEEWDFEEERQKLAAQEKTMRDHGRGLAISHSICNRIEHYRIDADNISYCLVIDDDGAA